MFSLSSQSRWQPQQLQEEDSSEEEERPAPVESVEAISGVLHLFWDRGHTELYGLGRSMQVSGSIA